VSAAAAGTGTVWVQLSDGRVLFSSDGGTTWANRTPPGWAASGSTGEVGQRAPGLAGESVSTTSAWLERGFAEGSGRLVEIAGTSDEGLSWRTEVLPTTSSDVSANDLTSPSGVSFVGSDGWAASAPLRLQADSVTDIFRTTDEGSTWTYETSVYHATGPVYFVTPTVGFDGTTPGQFALWETRDGGRSWSQASLPTPTGFELLVIPSDPIFTDPLHGFLYAYFEKHPAAEATYPYMYVTADGGITWTPEALPSSSQTSSGWPAWSVVDPSTWFLVGDNVVRETTDGGATWTSVSPDVTLTKVSFAQFVSRQVGYALIDTSNCSRSTAPAPPPCPATNGLAKTTDGGRTWDILPVPR
jgi:photosystem II stability/assembly factor-like uncharacterized protein